jgi:hypothetical protein
MSNMAFVLRVNVAAFVIKNRSLMGTDTDRDTNTHTHKHKHTHIHIHTHTNTHKLM